MKIGRNKSGVIENETIRNKIISQLQNTEYYLREQEKYKKADDTIQDYQDRISRFSPDSIELIKEDIVRKIDRAETKFYNEPEKFCVYMDIDMFFVAVELLSCPSLRDKAVVVGSGVVAAANYIARKYGIRSAMPIFIAKELCKGLLVIPVHMEKYKEYSERIYNYIEEYDPHYVHVGLDEGYFYINPEDYKIHDNDTIDDGVNNFIERFKGRVLKDVGLTISVGVAPTKMLAKMSSEINKPDGKFILRKNRTIIRAFMESLRVGKIPGIGPVNEHILKGLGIETVKQLRDNLYMLQLNYNEKSFDSLLLESIGVIETVLTPVVNPSFNKSRTFTATKDMDGLRTKLAVICEEVFEKCINDNSFPKTLDLVTKFSDFKVKSRAMTLKQPIKTHKELYSYALKLLGVNVAAPIRLLGVKVCNFNTINEEETIENFIVNKYRDRLDNLVSSRNSLNFVNCGENGHIDVTSKVVCPICNEELEFYGNNAMLNRHIDGCEGEKVTESPRVPISSQKKRRS